MRKVLVGVMAAIMAAGMLAACGGLRIFRF